MTAREVVDARKVRLGRADLAALFADAERIVVAKAKRLVVLDAARAKPTLDELADLVLGPSGNLRAPTLKLGRTYLVGFGGDAWREWLRR